MKKLIKDNELVKLKNDLNESLNKIDI